MKPREAGEGLSQRRTPASSPPLLAFSLCVFLSLVFPFFPAFQTMSLPLDFVSFFPLVFSHPTLFLLSEFQGIYLKRK